MHKIYHSVEDKIDMLPDGEAERWDEWDHFFFVGNGTTIQCVYSHAGSEAIGVTDVMDGEEHYGENEISFNEIESNILSDFIRFVFNEKT